MSTCVETQTAGVHQLDNMTGLQKHPRTKAAASRYIVFHHACFFELFARFREYHVVRKQCFPFLRATNVSGFPWIPIRCPRSQLYQALRTFSFSCCQPRPAKALSCDLPTRDRISSKGPAKYGLVVSTQQNKWNWLLQAGKLQGTTSAVHDFPDCPIIRISTEEHRICHSSRLNHVSTTSDAPSWIEMWLASPCDTSNHTNGLGHRTQICSHCLMTVPNRHVGVIRLRNHQLHAAAPGIYMSTYLKIINNKPS
jgi:hypothetical protein